MAKQSISPRAKESMDNIANSLRNSGTRMKSIETTKIIAIIPPIHLRILLHLNSHIAPPLIFLIDRFTKTLFSKIYLLINQEKYFKVQSVTKYDTTQLYHYLMVNTMGRRLDRKKPGRRKSF
jgi:hypothetical protein